ncbi:MAG TPA: DinB family protein [Ferruginibacter sp.]|nr:DinB family protein [Ferruginibacter sp.]
MIKNEIISATADVFQRFSQTCSSMDETVLFQRPANKWSVAENIQHLVISTNTTTLAYSLPKFLVKWIGGTPNRNSRAYEEVKEKYYKKLSEGGQASGRFIPRPIEIKYGRQKLLDNWERATVKYINALAAKRSEKDLDSYLVKHPLLGRITLRELCYFTIFHTEHHLNSIHKNLTVTA